MIKVKILFGTRNKNKAIEAKAIFNEISPELELISLDEIDPNRLIDEPIEDGISFYENALIKAKYYFDKVKLPTICDDSGICVDALNGKPGIFSARFSKGTIYEEDNINRSNNKMLLDLMKEKTNRKAHYTCEMVFYDSINIINGTGILNGLVLFEETGQNGFGYDPLFYIEEYKMSLGELDEKTKNTISHRYKAIVDIANKIDETFKKA